MEQDDHEDKDKEWMTAYHLSDSQVQGTHRIMPTYVFVSLLVRDTRAHSLLLYYF